MSVNVTLDDKLCDKLYELIADKVMLDIIGPRYVPNWYRYTFGIIYSLIFITGVIGNFGICLVIATNKHMHRSTNFYLFSLAISDITILLFGLTVELVQTHSQLYPWRYGVYFCHLRILMLELTPIASVLTITAFSVERYVAICHPMKAHVISSRKRTCIVIGFSWAIALCFSLPISAMSKSEHVASYPNDTAKYLRNSTINVSSCISPELKEKPRWYVPGERIPQSLACFPDLSIPHFSVLLKITAITFFVMPMILILILYTLIAKRLFLTSALANNINSKSLKSRKSVTKMLAAVVISFFSCWAPYHLQRIITIYDAVSLYSPTFLLVLFYVSGSLFYVSSTINPVIYNLMSARFRQAFCFTLRKSVFCCLDATNWHSTLEFTFQNNQERNFNSYHSGSKLNIYPVKPILFPEKTRLHKSSSGFLTVNSQNSVYRYSSVESLGIFSEKVKTPKNYIFPNTDLDIRYKKTCSQIISSSDCSNVIKFCQQKKLNSKQKNKDYLENRQIVMTSEKVPMIRTTFIDDKI